MVRELQRRHDIPCLGDIHLGDRLEGDGDMTSSGGAAGSLPPSFFSHLGHRPGDVILFLHTGTDGHRYPRTHSSVTSIVSCFCRLAIFTINSRFQDGFSRVPRSTVFLRHFSSTSLYGSFSYPLPSVSTAFSLHLCPYD